MLSVGTLAFLNPWVLAGLAALPILWWLLRAIPPSPRTQIFAGVRLLLGLEDNERQTDKTPWWLLLLRCLAIAAALIGLAQPVANLTARLSDRGGPLLLLMDQGWASAPDWTERLAAARAVLTEAGEAGRDVVFWLAADSELPPVVSAAVAIERLSSATPRTWEPDHRAIVDALRTDARDISETVWLNDGLARDGTEELLALLAGRGPLRVIGPQVTVRALTPPRLEDGRLAADVIAAEPGGRSQVVALMRAEGGGERRIAVAEADLSAVTRATVTFDLPAELQSSITRIALADRPTAGGAAFADSAIRRIRAGLIASSGDAVVTTLTSATHYLEKAMIPWATMTRGTLPEIVAADPDVIVLPDYGDFADGERETLTSWIEAGGVLIRFAGPRLAASIGAQGFGTVQANDPLLPVRLRRGGRVLGGALAWSAPRSLGPFAQESPFRGLVPPNEVDVRTQVLAEPSPDLAGKVWAALDDGTPLVTAARVGEGRLVLFHVSGDAEWSSLPLSGLFVEMLGRVTALSVSGPSGGPDPEEVEGTLWRAELLMGADGSPSAVSAIVDSVPGERLAEGRIGPKLAPGIYRRADNAGRVPGETERVVMNLTTDATALSPFPAPPVGAIAETLGALAPERYGPWLLTLAILLVLLDVLGTLIVSGRLGSRTAATGLVVALAVLGTASESHAQEVAPEAIAATAETTLGYVITGDERIDQISERGLIGLGAALAQRTAVEPGPPVGVRLSSDELSFYPVLYWPLTAEHLPDPAALEALSAYLATGGMLIIDTQNGASGFGGATGTQMRAIARALNLPPLAPVDEDHVLTRTFYLLTSFPGRWRGGRVWAEAAPPTSESAEKNPDIPQFDRVDDNVSPVLVGSADWAAAWAIDQSGLPLLPIGRPGDRQREMALRFGINAVMYALTGNYKSDQVHAPAVLQRLGQ